MKCKVCFPQQRLQDPTIQGFHIHFYINQILKSEKNSDWFSSTEHIQTLLLIYRTDNSFPHRLQSIVILEFFKCYANVLILIKELLWTI